MSTPIYNIDADEQGDWNNELNALKESGTMNMFGAVRWLEEEFELPRAYAEQVFNTWTKSLCRR